MLEQVELLQDKINELNEQLANEQKRANNLSESHARLYHKCVDGDTEIAKLQDLLLQANDRVSIAERKLDAVMEHLDWTWQEAIRTVNSVGMILMPAIIESCRKQMDAAETKYRR